MAIDHEFWDAQLAGLLARYREPDVPAEALRAIGERVAGQLPDAVEANLQAMLPQYREPEIDARRLKEIGEGLGAMLEAGKAAEARGAGRESIPAAPDSAADAKAPTARRLTRQRPSRRLRPVGPAASWGAWAAIAACVLAAVATLVVMSGDGPGRSERRVARVEPAAPTPVAVAPERPRVAPTPAGSEKPPAPTPVQPERRESAQAGPARALPEAGAGEKAPAAPAQAATPEAAVRAPASLAAVPPAAPSTPAVAEPKPSTAVAAAAIPAPPAILARVERAQGQVVLVKGTDRAPAQARDALFAGHGLETAGAESLAALKYDDATRLDVKGDATIAGLWDREPGQGASPARGRRVELTRGELTADVARQPAKQPMAFTTPHAEATVLGTRFTLTVTGQFTRLEVKEGRVRFTRLSDRASTEVRGGFYAVASPTVAPQAKPVGGEPPALLADDFEDARAASERWQVLKGGYPAAVAGKVDVDLAPRAGASEDWSRAGGVHSRAAFRLPLRVSVDVDVTHRHESLLAAVLFLPSSEKPYEQNTFFVELRGGDYVLMADQDPVASVAAGGEWPRHERWMVEVVGDEVRLSVDGRDTLRARHGKRVFEAYHVGLEGNARSDAPREGRARFDNVRIENVKPQ